MIEIRNVSKSFEKQKILNNINLVIDDNSITCLLVKVVVVKPLF